MKRKIYLLSMAIGLMAIGCKNSEEKSVKDMFDDKKNEAEIYEHILTDSVRMAKFMDKVAADKKARRAVMCNVPMLKEMCMTDHLSKMMKADAEVMNIVSDNLINSMQNDTVVCINTCNKMFKNEATRAYLKERACKEFKLTDKK